MEKLVVSGALSLVLSLDEQRKNEKEKIKQVAWTFGVRKRTEEHNSATSSAKQSDRNFWASKINEHYSNQIEKTSAMPL